MGLLNGRMKCIFAGGPLKYSPRSLTYFLFSLSTSIFFRSHRYLLSSLSLSHLLPPHITLLSHFSPFLLSPSTPLLGTASGGHTVASRPPPPLTRGRRPYPALESGGSGSEQAGDRIHCPRPREQRRQAEATRRRRPAVLAATGGSS